MMPPHLAPASRSLRHRALALALTALGTFGCGSNEVLFPDPIRTDACARASDCSPEPPLRCPDGELIVGPGLVPYCPIPDPVLGGPQPSEPAAGGSEIEPTPELLQPEPTRDAGATETPDSAPSEPDASDAGASVPSDPNEPTPGEPPRPPRGLDAGVDPGPGPRPPPPPRR
jgi:hypothetical protein